MLSDKMLRQASLLAARSIPAIRLTAPGVIENTIPGIHFIPILAATPLMLPGALQVVGVDFAILPLFNCSFKKKRFRHPFRTGSQVRIHSGATYAHSKGDRYTVV